MANEGDNWFIGLPVEAEALPARARRELPRGTRAFHPDDLHVTVAFLGAVGEHRALSAWETLALPPGDPPTAAIGPRATFGPRRQPSALGLDIDADRDDGEIVRFIRSWRDPLRIAAGVAAETRPVRPHVTLGRPPRRPGADWWRACRAWLAAGDAPTTLHLQRVALYTRAHADEPERRFRRVRSRDWTQQQREKKQ